MGLETEGVSEVVNMNMKLSGFLEMTWNWRCFQGCKWEMELGEFQWMEIGNMVLGKNLWIDAWLGEFII
ncbi:MAG: hypothetical protein GY702_09625 [Desulfobulbaceae bacterium]|nr:hypothetical protein [Desulfobulbaceae bacterium]